MTSTPGDVFLHDDPYTDGIHPQQHRHDLPGLHRQRTRTVPVRSPCTGNVGGTTPGSISGKSTEIFHDGVRLPIVRIAHRGKLTKPFLT